MLRSKFVRDHFADPEWENEIPYLYLDSQDKMTVGIGCRIFSQQDAEALKFVYREDQIQVKGKEHTVVARKGDEASTDAIDRDYKVVNEEAGKGWAATSFKKVTRLDLPVAEIDRLFFDRVKTFETSLRSLFPDYDSYPAPAQLALLDMIFNLGSAGLTKFTKLVEAAKKRDWSTAAGQCHRLKIPERRNTRTEELFRQAAEDEKMLQQHKKPTGKVMPRNVKTQPHAWYDPVFDVLEEIFQKLKSNLIPPRAQGRK